MADTPKKRKMIKSEGREIIARVYHFLHDEYNFMKTHNSDNCDLSPLAKLISRTAGATGVSEKTVSKILKEEKELASTSGRFPSPMEKRKKRTSKFDFDSSNIDIIRTVIENYRNEFNEEPTLRKLKSILEKRVGFEGCLTSLRTLLSKLGYKFQQNGGKRVLVRVQENKKKKCAKPVLQEIKKKNNAVKKSSPSDNIREIREEQNQTVMKPMNEPIDGYEEHIKEEENQSSEKTVKQIKEEIDQNDDSTEQWLTIEEHPLNSEIKEENIDLPDVCTVKTEITNS